LNKIESTKISVAFECLGLSPSGQKVCFAGEDLNGVSNFLFNCSQNATEILELVYTLSHNGKIERFWLTLATTTGSSHDETTIANFIHHYNFVWKHSSLGVAPQAACNGIPRLDQLAPGALDPDI
jgi:hypothetical protein